MACTMRLCASLATSSGALQSCVNVCQTSTRRSYSGTAARYSPSGDQRTESMDRGELRQRVTYAFRNTRRHDAPSRIDRCHTDTPRSVPTARLPAWILSVVTNSPGSGSVPSRRQREYVGTCACLLRFSASSRQKAITPANEAANCVSSYGIPGCCPSLARRCQGRHCSPLRYVGALHSLARRRTTHTASFGCAQGRH